MSVPQLLSELASLAQIADFSTEISTILSVNMDSPSTIQIISRLQSELQGLSDTQISQLVDQHDLFGGNWSNFGNFVASYLRLCRDLNPGSLLQSSNLLLYYVNDMCICFTNSRYGHQLNELVLQTLRYVLPLFTRIDLVLNVEHGKKFKRLTFVSTVLSKVFNYLRSVKSGSGSPLLLFVVNELNKIYFRIGSPLLCSNILANLNQVSSLSLSQYPMAQQLEYRFILARYYLMKNQIVRSFDNLAWCYAHSLRLANDHNNIRILRYLIPMGLLVGKLPSPQLLDSIPEFRKYFRNLVRHLRNGDHCNYQLELLLHQHYFRQHGLLFLLQQQARIVIFRNLLLNVSKMTAMTTKMPFSVLETAVRLSIGDETRFGTSHSYKVVNNSQISPLQIVENVCISLIDNNLLKGSLAVKNRLLVLSRTNPFPPVYETLAQAFPYKEEPWMRQ